LHGNFIPIAEESGLIHQIGYKVMKEACEQLRIWQEEHNGEHPLKMSVNVSGGQLLRDDFIREVDDILLETGINPANLCLEITESAIIKDSELAAEKLFELKELGVKIHLDDFGTGYSSLSYLSRFPIDTIKIDHRFIMNLTQGNHRGLVRTIVAMGNELGLTVVGEGIETVEQLDFLRGLDCQYGQGYYFFEPLEAEEVGEELRVLS
jgi:EAL domain-containing protein (putative c-di-GMP-specific phosphodiesterase class I)